LEGEIGFHVRLWIGLRDETKGRAAAGQCHSVRKFDPSLMTWEAPPPADVITSGNGKPRATSARRTG
jgi:hypothetical protein